MEQNEEVKEMTFLDHLEELRWTLVRSAIAILLVAITAFVMKDFVFNKIIFAPMYHDFVTYRWFCGLSQFLGLGDALCLTASTFNLQSVTMVGQFMSHLMVAIMTGLVVAFPFIFWELWRFLKPALHKKEKKLARGLVFYSTLLFSMGVLFGYFLIAPLSVQFLGGYSVSDLVTTTPTINSYITTIVSVTLASGIIFLLPIAVYMLSKFGILSPELLKKYRRHALVGVLILSAIITPPDVASQIVVAVPVLLLYEFSIFISRRVRKKMEAQD